MLFNAQQHAREWLAGETCRRTLEYFVTSYGDNARVTRLVDTRELWFVCISNPDGHEYTFTPGNRLWRKNMADNDGDGVRGEPNDGVDPNRNFATNFGLDDEGSSSDPTLRDLPRHRPGLRARDEGDEEALGPRRLRVPEERPHRRRAAAVAAGLPEVHADGRQRHLRGAGRHRPRLGDPGRRGDVRPRPLVRALHHQRRHARRRLPRARHPRLHPRGHQLAHPRRHRLRVRGRRAGGAGGVRAPPEVLARPRRVRGRSGGPGVAPRQRDEGLLPRPRSRRRTATRSRSR